jgi:hypothetical protein
MRPAPECITAGVPAKHRAYVLAEAGRAYALYLARDTKAKDAPTGPQTASLELAVPDGRYAVEWVHPRTGAVEARAAVTSAGGRVTLTTPAFEEDIALALRRL